VGVAGRFHPLRKRPLEQPSVGFPPNVALFIASPQVGALSAAAIRRVLNRAAVVIPIIDDRMPESGEVFTVHLSPPGDAVAGDVTTTRVTLSNDHSV
jgi:hypothetical protein